MVRPRKGAGSDGGGRSWATIATLLQTAKMNNIDPLAWLTQTLERIANGWPSSEIDALMPCWGGRLPTASQCATMSSLKAQSRETVRGRAYPKWHGYVKREIDRASIGKAHVKRGKNDAVDAEALSEATSRPTMRFVPVKTADQQAALMLVGFARETHSQSNAARQCHTRVCHGVRHCCGQGHVPNRTVDGRIAADQSPPALARELFAMHALSIATCLPKRRRSRKN